MNKIHKNERAGSKQLSYNRWYMCHDCSAVFIVYNGDAICHCGSTGGSEYEMVKPSVAKEKPSARVGDGKP